MKPPVVIVREAYDRYSRRDLTGVFSLLSPAIEVEQTSLLPWGGKHCGHAGAKRFFSLLAEYTDAMPTAVKFIEAGQEVAVVGRLTGTARKTGKKIDIDIVHLWTVENEKVVRFAAFIDTPAMLEAISQSETKEPIQPVQPTPGCVTLYASEGTSI